MNATNPKNLSPFAQAALALDDDFAQLERLSGEIDRLAIDTDNGLDRAKLLLVRFGECGERVGQNIQALATALSESQKRAEKAAQSVSARAALVQERQQEANRLLERFQGLGEMVRKVTEAVVQLQNPAKGALSPEEKALLVKHLPELNEKLGVLADEAFKIKDEARESKMKALEKDADALGQSMQAMRRKLSSLG